MAKRKKKAKKAKSSKRRSRKRTKKASPKRRRRGKRRAKKAAPKKRRRTRRKKAAAPKKRRRHRKAKKGSKKRKVRRSPAARKYREASKHAKALRRELKKQEAHKNKDQRKIESLRKKLAKAQAAEESRGRRRHKRRHHAKRRHHKRRHHHGRHRHNPIAANPVGSKGGIGEFAAGFAGVVVGGLLAMTADRLGSTAALASAAGTNSSGAATTIYTDNAGAPGGTYNSQGPSTPIWSSWKRMAYAAGAILVPLGVSAAVPDKHPAAKTFMQLTFFGALTITGVKFGGDVLAKLLGGTSFGARLYAPEGAAVSQIASNGAGSTLPALTLSTTAGAGNAQAVNASAMLAGTPKRRVGANTSFVPGGGSGGATRLVPVGPSPSPVASPGGGVSTQVANGGPTALPEAPPNAPTPVSHTAPPPGSISLPMCNSCSSYSCPGASGGTCDVAGYDPMNPTGETHPSFATPDTDS